MKYRYLSIILLILIFSLGAVSAQDNATDVISAGSDDVISIEEAPVLQDNGTSTDEIHINDANFNQYFDENDTMNDNVSADSTIFIGEITNKSLYINKPVFVVPDETSKITDSNINFILGSDGSTIKGLTFNNTDGCRAISVWEANGIVVFQNIINIASNTNMTDSAIFAQEANNFNATANTIRYNGKSDGESNVTAMVIIQSEDAVIEDNYFEIDIPSNDVLWVEPYPGNWVGIPRSAGITVSNSNGLSFKRNEIYLNATDVFGSEDTIYVVDIGYSDNVQFDENTIVALGHKYIYGLVISGENIDIIGNSFSIKSDTNYANGIDIEGGSSADVEDNDLYIISPNVAYPIYSAMNWGTMESPNVDYIDNVIIAESDAVYGMHLSGTESSILGNTISIFGNYTMGIYSFMTDDVAIIMNNKIDAYGLKNDTKSTGDMIPAQTVGILATSESEIHNNIIDSHGNYTIVSSSYDSEITDNYLVAKELIGDESVDDRTDEAIVENNIPNSEDDYELTNDTFFLFFDEYGHLRDGISGNLTFIGNFSNLVKEIIITEPVNLLSDDATLYDMGIEILCDDVTVDGFNFITNSLDEVICVENADNVSIRWADFIVNGLADSNNTVIHVVDSNDVEIVFNTINFTVVTNGTYRNNAILGEGCEDLLISDTNIYAYLPSRPVDWNTGIAYSEAVCLDDCDYAALDDNGIGVMSNDKIGDYDTIYAVQITGDNASVINSRIGAIEAPYGYALVISGKNYLIHDNYLAAGENGSYACAVDVESNSDGSIKDNEIYVVGESAYGIYTADWAGDVKANIAYNKIDAYGTNVFGMSLSGSETVVADNIINAYGNFTTGIASAADMIFITGNKISANGTNIGAPTGYDTMGIETIGVHIVEGDALVKNNTINANSKYAVSVEGTGAVTDNEIYADMLTGDFAVDYVQDTGVLVANNTPAMELTYKLTNDTFFIYFDENGQLREQIDADNLTFIGPFSNLVEEIIIDEQVNLYSDNATLYNMGIEILHGDLIVDGFNFISDSLNEVICVENANNVYIINNNFTVNGLSDDDNDVIHILNSEDTRVDNNIINFAVETNETYKNTVIHAIGSDGVHISRNTINASLPARSINWTTGTVYSEGVCFDDCNDALLEDSTIIVRSNDNIGEYDTIYAVHITGDDVLVTRNSIAVADAPYGYAIVIAGKDFDISNNAIAATQNGTYACGIDVESNSNGVIDENFIVAYGESAYGIYTADWAGDVKTNITNNDIFTNGTNVFGMSLSGSEADVKNNSVYADGNFTTGIASTVDMISITDNEISANGTNIGAPTSYDTMGIETVGVHIVDGDALVKNNNITTSGEYTVSVEGTGAVTDNYLVAKEYTGDASVNSTPEDTLVANNTPAMQRAIVNADDVVMYYKNGTRYVILLTDQNGNALPNETVTITLNGVSYNRKTDANGTASIAINLLPGNYTASVLYVGENNFTNTTSENNITVLTTILGDDLVKVFRNGTQYYATFLDGQGNPLAHGTDVTFNINGVFYTRQVNGSEGKAKLNINLNQGEYIITAYNPVNGEAHANNITVLPLIQSNDLVKYFRNESQFVVTVLGADGNPVGAGENVTFNINGVFYTRQTNELGQAKLNINLAQGNYTITTMYNGCSVANNIEVLPILYAKDLVMKQGTSDQFRAQLYDGQGNPYAGQNITFNIHGIFYQRTTDADGWATLNIKLSAAANTYIITSMYNDCVISNKIVIEPA